MPCTAEFFLRPPQPRCLLTHGFFSRVQKSTGPLLPHAASHPGSSLHFPEASIQPASQPLVPPQQTSRTISSSRRLLPVHNILETSSNRGISPLIFLKPVVVSPAWRGLQAGNTDLEAGASRAAERSGVGTVPTCLYRGPLNQALTTHH